MRRVLAAALSALAMLAISGCDQVLVAEPREQDLLGVYKLTTESESFLREHKGYRSIPSCTIELKSGSIISIRNLPGFDGFGESAGAFLSGDGKWRVEKAFIGYGLTLEILPGGAMKPGIYAGPWIHIRRRWSPYELEITIGDPDSGESMRYARVSS